MRKILGNVTDPETSSGPYTNNWMGEAERLLMYLDIIFMLLTSSHFTPLNMCPVLRLLTSDKKNKDDNNNNNNNNNNNKVQ